MKQTPGTALNTLIQKHGLNYNRLAKAIGLSSAMVRLIARDENPISAQVAFRLAKFFKNKPTYWLDLQVAYEIEKTAGDKILNKALNAMPTVDTATFERKRKTPKNAKPKGAAAKKAGAARRGRPPKNCKKPAAAKAAKRGRPPKAGAQKKIAAKTPAKRGRPAGRPAAKPAKTAVKKRVVVKPQPKPESQASTADSANGFDPKI